MENRTKTFCPILNHDQSMYSFLCSHLDGDSLWNKGCVNPFKKDEILGFGPHEDSWSWQGQSWKRPGICIKNIYTHTLTNPVLSGFQSGNLRSTFWRGWSITISYASMTGSNVTLCSLYLYATVISWITAEVFSSRTDFWSGFPSNDRRRVTVWLCQWLNKLAVLSGGESSRDKRHGTQTMGLWSSHPCCLLSSGMAPIYLITHTSGSRVLDQRKTLKCILGVLERPQSLGWQPSFSFMAVCHWFISCLCHVWTSFAGHADQDYLSCFLNQTGW